MQHFAQLDENNIVVFVCPIDDSNCLDTNGNISEEVGINYCKSFYEPIYGSNTTWKQTDYNGIERVRYAGIGYSYSEEYDAFLCPQPYPSWILNTQTYNWEPPVPEPECTEDQEGYYEWNEESQEWQLKTLR